jgi:hypothetical protein
MEPLVRIGAAAREPAGGPPRGDAASAGRTALAVGETAEVAVLARLSGGVYVVKSGGSALLVTSAVPLEVGGSLVVVGRSAGRPALLAPVSPDFAALVDTSRAPASLASDVGALLERGARVSAEFVRSTPGGSYVSIEGARLAVDVQGGVGKAGAFVVVGPSQPTRVELVAKSPASTAAPAWFDALVRELARRGSARDVGEVLLEVAQRLRESAGRGPAAERLLARLEAALVPPRDGAELALRLATDGTRSESRLAAAVLSEHESLRSARSDAQRADLRAALASTLGEVSAPNAREALTRALDVLQAGALVAAGREQLGSPAWFALPLFDGSRATTAWLRWRREPRRDGEPDEGTQRATLAVEFSALGPVRVDVAFAAQRLVVRVTVAQHDVLAELRAHADALTTLLASGGREVVFGTALASEETLRIDPVALEHHDAYVDTRG